MAANDQVKRLGVERDCGDVSGDHGDRRRMRIHTDIARARDGGEPRLQAFLGSQMKHGETSGGNAHLGQQIEEQEPVTPEGKATGAERVLLVTANELSERSLAAGAGQRVAPVEQRQDERRDSSEQSVVGEDQRPISGRTELVIGGRRKQMR